MKTHANNINALLREELKSRKLSALLHQLGVEECQWLPSLNEHIAESLGLSSDESFLEYDRLMDTAVSNIHNCAELAEAVDLIS